uniref:C-type lectin domain-containing protein n=1 Tax=Elaeophora elaphi TaxID=1147741 RepID=A0A0R3S0J6_9BILA
MISVMCSFSIRHNFSAKFDFKHPFWIGLSKDGEEWKWPDGTKLRYHLWGENEPKAEHSCALADTEENGRHWHTIDCNNSMNYIAGYVCQQ